MKILHLTCLNNYLEIKPFLGNGCDPDLGEPPKAVPNEPRQAEVPKKTMNMQMFAEVDQNISFKRMA